jgi:hypothetical protein
MEDCVFDAIHHMLQAKDTTKLHWARLQDCAAQFADWKWIRRTFSGFMGHLNNFSGTYLQKTLVNEHINFWIWAIIGRANAEEKR